MSSSLLFVDPRVADYQSLLADLSADVEVYVLKANSNEKTFENISLGSRYYAY
jgi:hypothetical protein